MTVRSSTETAVDPVAVAGIPATLSKKLKVLVVEDDLAAYNMMKMLLQHYDYDVLHARDVAAALQQLEIAPDFVLLDLTLPDGEGSTVLQHVRKRALASRVFVISGTADSGLIERARRLKPDDVLRKPLNFYALLDRMQQPNEPFAKAV